MVASPRNPFFSEYHSNFCLMLVVVVFIEFSRSNLFLSSACTRQPLSFLAYHIPWFHSFLLIFTSLNHGLTVHNLVEVGIRHPYPKTTTMMMLRCCVDHAECCSFTEKCSCRTFGWNVIWFQKEILLLFRITEYLVSLGNLKIKQWFLSRHKHV